MKAQIESVIMFAATNNLAADKSNFDEVVSRLMYHLGSDNVLQAYHVTLDETSPGIKGDIARLIVRDVLKKHMPK